LALTCFDPIYQPEHLQLQKDCHPTGGQHPKTHASRCRPLMAINSSKLIK
jgi:hypothetical protein